MAGQAEPLGHVRRSRDSDVRGREHGVYAGAPGQRERPLPILQVQSLEMIRVVAGDRRGRPIRDPGFQAQLPRAPDIFELPQTAAENQQSFAFKLRIAGQRALGDRDATPLRGESGDLEETYGPGFDGPYWRASAASPSASLARSKASPCTGHVGPEHDPLVPPPSPTDIRVKRTAASQHVNERSR